MKPIKLISIELMLSTTNVEFDEVVATKEFFMRGVTQRDANNTTVSVSNIENKSFFDEHYKDPFHKGNLEGNYREFKFKNGDTFKGSF